MVCSADELLDWKDFPTGLKVFLIDRDYCFAAEMRLKLEVMDYAGEAFETESGEHLPILDHDAVISDIKCEGGEVHNELLESIRLHSKNKQSHDAVRIEAFYLGTNGCRYWRLKCLSNTSKISLQDFKHGNWMYRILAGQNPDGIFEMDSLSNATGIAAMAVPLFLA